MWCFWVSLKKIVRPSYERVVKVHRDMACSIGGSYFFPPFGLKEKLQVQIRYLLQQELVQPVTRVGRKIQIYAFSTTSLCFGRGGCYAFLFFLFVRWHTKGGGGGIDKRWKKHGIWFEWKGIFSVRLLYHEVGGGGKHSPAIVDGLRSEGFPLTVLSEGKHWYALSLKCIIDEQIWERVHLIMLSEGKR